MWNLHNTYDDDSLQVFRQRCHNMVRLGTHTDKCYFHGTPILHNTQQYPSKSNSCQISLLMVCAICFSVTTMPLLALIFTCHNRYCVTNLFNKQKLLDNTCNTIASPNFHTSQTELGCSS